jgi:membrane protease YdiL (CAAX protease family)
LLALLATVPAPTLGALLAFEVAPGAVGQVAYVLLRLWLAAVPLVWLLRVERARPSWSPVPPPLRREAALVAAATSVAFAAAIAAAYALVGREWIDAEELLRVTSAAGIGTPLRYAAFALWLSLVNSLVEEYVWRWFVFRRCEELAGRLAAVPLGALLFTLHHAVAFSLELGPRAGLLASLGVFTAGCAWSALYLRYRSIWPGWASHVAADLAGLAIGWRILFGHAG